MQTPTLIGTGFYSTHENNSEKHQQFALWLKNTGELENIVVVDNSERGLHPAFNAYVRVVRCYNNLGHASTPIAQCAGTPLLGWSMSWIIPALMAYSDGCDFIYKEQDCFAFGDWQSLIKKGRMAFGRNSQMPCEQSLFWIKNDFILQVVRDYLMLGCHETEVSTEEKFIRLKESFLDGEIEFFGLPGGRDRPLPDFTKPFYAQRITTEEMELLRRANLL